MYCTIYWTVVDTYAVIMVQKLANNVIERAVAASSSGAREPIKRILQHYNVTNMQWHAWCDAACNTHWLNNISFHIYFRCFERIMILLGHIIVVNVDALNKIEQQITFSHRKSSSFSSISSGGIWMVCFFFFATSPLYGLFTSMCCVCVYLWVVRLCACNSGCNIFVFPVCFVYDAAIMHCTI